MVLEERGDELVESCQRGEPEAFRELFERYKDKVYSVALRYAGDAAIAQDITQETFLKLYSTIGSFRGESGFESWLYRLVVNCCFDQKRKARRVVPIVNELLSVLRAPDPSILDEVLRSEMSEQVQSVVGSLAPAQRMIIVLRYTQGLSYDEIAGILGCSSGTIGSRLNRVHKVIARRLSILAGKSMPDTPWLARELSRQLAPVAAPDGLWAGIQEARGAPRRSFSFRWTVWPAFAALTLVSCLGLLRELTGMNRLTQNELAEINAGSKDPDFRSNDFRAIRAWVSAQTNIDIDLPPGQSVGGARPVRLIGARLIRFRGSRVAAIDYRVGDRVATLLVSGRRPRLSWSTEPSQHLFSQIRTQGGGRALSWDMGNEVYTIAFAGAREFHGACLICHDY